MYKLFLCLRYLRSRAVAYIAVLGVALCVAMMVIVNSVMTGFVNKIESAAKGLFGDIVMDSAGQHGLGYYDEFIEEVRRQVPEVQAAAPYILSYGILRIAGQEHYRHAVQVAGLRLGAQAAVTDFEMGLFAQRQAPRPTWDPPVDMLLRRVAEEHKATWDLRRRVDEGGLSAEKAHLLGRIDNALLIQKEADANLRDIDANRAALDRWQKELDRAEEDGADAETLGRLRWRVMRSQRVTWEDPGDRVILGLGIPALSFRTDKGKVVRLWLPGQKVVLYVFPLGRGGLDLSEMHPEIRNLSVVDDCKTGVASIDSAFVYIPFETLQKLNHMEAQYAAADPKRVVDPARCSQILFKAGPRQDLRKVRDKIYACWLDFRDRYPAAARTPVDVSTWRQRQEKVVGPIEAQRTLMVIILGIISLVALVLIFVIFYMIVMRKTRDIGVLKSIGASSGGVAGIFLAYGAAVGLAGSALGAAGGYAFVRNINPIADWLDTVFGFQPWDREFFMFDKIPNEVQLMTVVTIVIGAIVAGVVGSLIPAIWAARMQPVEALRYE